MLPDKAKFMECCIINPVTRKHRLVSAKKLLISRLFIGHHTVVWFPLVSIS